MSLQIKSSIYLSVSLMLSGLMLLTPVSAPRAQDKPERPALPRLGDKTALLDKCGPDDDSQAVEFYGTGGKFKEKFGITKTNVRNHEPSTLQLQWLESAAMQSKMPGYMLGNVAGERWCTGTLVSDRYVLTAGHCFDIQDKTWDWETPYKLTSSGDKAYAEPPQLATLMQVNFNYQLNLQTGVVRTPDAYPVSRLVEWRQGPDKLDYAIFEIGVNAAGELPDKKKYKPATLRLTEPAKGEVINIIQHPQGNPKRVDVGHVSELTSFQVRYDNLDTFGGSSGSGIRDSKGVVAGVHTNGGCESGGANKGVRNSAIANVSPKLKELAK